MQEPTLQTYTRADYTLEEYERAAEHSEFKLEFYEGQIIMSSPSSNHAEIADNILGETRKQIRRLGWRILKEGCEIRPPVLSNERPTVFQPDIIVYFPEEGPRNMREIPNPIAIIEVLSPTTEDKDRGPKFERCARIPELRHFVLIDQFRMEVEHRFRTDADADWQTEVLTRPEDRLLFAEVPFDLSLAQIYEDIPLET